MWTPLTGFPSQNPASSSTQPIENLPKFLIPLPTTTSALAVANLTNSEGETTTSYLICCTDHVIYSVTAGIGESASVVRFAGQYADGTIFVGESSAHTIRRILGDQVELLAGTGDVGDEDGPAESATFGSPLTLAYSDSTATLFVMDHSNALIRQIRHGMVTTLTSNVQNPFLDLQASQLFCWSGDCLLLPNNYESIYTHSLKTKKRAHTWKLGRKNVRAMLPGFSFVSIDESSFAKELQIGSPGEAVMKVIPTKSNTQAPTGQYLRGLLGVTINQRHGEIACVHQYNHGQPGLLILDASTLPIWTRTHKPRIPEVDATAVLGHSLAYAIHNLREPILEALNIAKTDLVRVLESVDEDTAMILLKCLHTDPEAIVASQPCNFDSLRRTIHAVHLMDTLGQPINSALLALETILASLKPHEICKLLLSTYQISPDVDSPLLELVAFFVRYHVEDFTQLAASAWVQEFAANPTRVSTLFTSLGVPPPKNPLEIISTSTKSRFGQRREQPNKHSTSFPAAPFTSTSSSSHSAAGTQLDYAIGKLAAQLAQDVAWNFGPQTAEIPAGMFRLSVAGYTPFFDVADWTLERWSYFQRLKSSGLAEIQQRRCEFPAEFPPGLLLAVALALHGQTKFDLAERECAYALEQGAEFELWSLEGRKPNPPFAHLLLYCRRTLLVAPGSTPLLSFITSRLKFGTAADFEEALLYEPIKIDMEKLKSDLSSLTLPPNALKRLTMEDIQSIHSAIGAKSTSSAASSSSTPTRSRVVEDRTEDDIALVMNQTGVTREIAAAALQRTNGDIVSAILDLTI